MKLVKKTDQEIILVDKKILETFIGILFILVGCYMTYSIFSKDSNIKEYVFALVFVISGFLALFLGIQRKTHINIISGKIILEEKTLLNKKVSTCEISSVAQVQLRQTTSYQTSSTGLAGLGMSKPVISNQVVLLLKDGLSIPLETSKSARGFSVMGIKRSQDHEKSMNLAIMLGTFLNVPFQMVEKDVAVPPAQKDLTKR